MVQAAFSAPPFVLQLPHQQALQQQAIFGGGSAGAGAGAGVAAGSSASSSSAMQIDNTRAVDEGSSSSAMQIDNTRAVDEGENEDRAGGSAAGEAVDHRLLAKWRGIACSLTIISYFHTGLCVRSHCIAQADAHRALALVLCSRQRTLQRARDDVLKLLSLEHLHIPQASAIAAQLSSGHWDVEMRRELVEKLTRVQQKAITSNIRTGAVDAAVASTFAFNVNGKAFVGKGSMFGSFVLAPVNCLIEDFASAQQHLGQNSTTPLLLPEFDGEELKEISLLRTLAADEQWQRQSLKVLALRVELEKMPTTSAASPNSSSSNSNSGSSSSSSNSNCCRSLGRAPNSCECCACCRFSKLGERPRNCHQLKFRRLKLAFRAVKLDLTAHWSGQTLTDWLRVPRAWVRAQPLAGPGI